MSNLSKYQRQYSTLSIVIPTLNESRFLKSTVKLVRAQSATNNVEIIVADCGSTDGTVDIARQCNTQVIEGNNVWNRAIACNAGAQVASRETLLFLHADCQPPAQFDRLIVEALEDESLVGGAFEFALDGPEHRLRLVEFLNRIRYRCTGRFFGDQGIFIRRKVFRRISGFCDLPILEDAHLCGKARHFGRMKLLPVNMRTSPRRFYNGGILTTLASDIAILATNMLGRVPEKTAKAYRLDNIKRGQPKPSQTSHPTRTQTPAQMAHAK